MGVCSTGKQLNLTVVPKDDFTHAKYNYTWLAPSRGATGKTISVIFAKPGIQNIQCMVNANVEAVGNKEGSVTHSIIVKGWYLLYRNTLYHIYIVL